MNTPHPLESFSDEELEKIALAAEKMFPVQKITVASEIPCNIDATIKIAFAAGEASFGKRIREYINMRASRARSK